MISNNKNVELERMLTNAEATKIYNEINQLRNHQFYITLAALTFFGVSLGKVFDLSKSISIDTLNSQLTLIFLIVAGLQVVLFGLFYWLTGLSKLIAILSVYLKEKNYSDWEIDFSNLSEISNDPESKKQLPNSQRQLMAWVFLILGTLSPIVVIVNFLFCYLYLQDSKSSEALIVVLFVIFLFVFSTVYYFVIDYLGFKHPSVNREMAEGLWESRFPGLKTKGKSK